MGINEIISTLGHRCTNESLAAIVNGLDVNETDDILAICGSGDQAFALLEKAHSVTAVDIYKNQVDYARYRKRCLKEEKYAFFQNMPAKG